MQIVEMAMSREAVTRRGREQIHAGEEKQLLLFGFERLLESLASGESFHVFLP